MQAPKIPLNDRSAKPLRGGLALGPTATDSFLFSVIPACSGDAAAAVVSCSTNGFIPPTVFGWEGSKAHALPRSSAQKTSSLCGRSPLPQSPEPNGRSSFSRNDAAGGLGLIGHTDILLDHGRMVAFGLGHEADVVFPDRLAGWRTAPFAESR